MSGPTAHPATGGAPPANISSTPSSYAAAVTKSMVVTPRLAPVPLASRPITYVNNMPALILTSFEEDELRKQRENTLIMKFSAGMPNMYEIRCHIHSEWGLDQPPAVGVIDKRHITLHMASPADTKRALACTTNKIKTSMFRLFRWTPDFEIGKDSSLTAVWVKMYDLPLHYYNESSLYRLGSMLGTVLRVHPTTIRLAQQGYVKVCIELDVSKPFTDKLWIGTSNDYGWEISLEYEGNHAYCDYCGLLGHTLGLCRKKTNDQGKAVATDEDERGTGTHKKTTGTNVRREQWVEKNRENGTVMEKEKPSSSKGNLSGSMGSERVGLDPKLGDILLREQENEVSGEVRQKLLDTGLLTQSAEGVNTKSSDEVQAGSEDGSHHKSRTKSVEAFPNKFSLLATEEESNMACHNLQLVTEPNLKVNAGCHKHEDTRELAAHTGRSLSDKENGSDPTSPVSVAELRSQNNNDNDEMQLVCVTDQQPSPRMTRLDGYNSDGAGSKSRSNMGVPFIQSDDDLRADTTKKILPPRATKLAAAKRIKQSIKDKHIS